MPIDSPLQIEPGQDDVLSVVLDCAQIGLITFDRTDRCTGINSQARTLLGLSGSASIENLSGLLALVQPALKTALEGAGEAVVSTDGAVLRIGHRRSEHGSRVVTIASLMPAQTLREQRLLARVGGLRSRESRPNDFPSQILQSLFEELPLDVAVLAVLDGEVLRPVAWRGLLLDPVGAPISLGDPVIHRAVSTGEVVQGTGEEPSLTANSENYYVVPLVADGVVHGVLQVGFVATARESWGQIAPNFLKELGLNIANALQNLTTLQKLVDEENRLRSLVESLPEGVLVFNGRGEVLVSNPAAREVLEIDLRRLNTDPRPYQLRDASMQMLARAEWPFFRAARLGQMIQDELVIFDFEGRFKYVEVSVVLLPSVDGRTTHFLGALRDVTQRTQDDRRKDEFLSVASHELRSPLTPLRGLIQMALQQVERGEKVDQKLLSRANEQTHRLARLIDDLLDVSRIDSGHLIVVPENVDLGMLAKNLVSGLWPDVEVTCEDEVVAWVDPCRIEQVIVNLVENARKHSQHRLPIEIRVSESGPAAVICVRDDGQGIAPEHLPHIFERFYRAGGRASGTGLGLSISQQIIEQHGGRLRLESEPGKGTSLYIELPTRSH